MILAIEHKCMSAFVRMYEKDSAGMRPSTKVEHTSPVKKGSTAILPLHGYLDQHPSVFLDLVGGTSTAQLASDMRDLAEDSSVGAILLHVNSPGGSVAGVQEAAEVVRQVGKRKPVVAQVDSLAASAAYWIASQANQVYASPGAGVGGIGVYLLHQDLSELYEREGVRPTYIYEGKYKVEGNPTEPLSEDALEHFQSMVSNQYYKFVNDVAKGRQVSVEKALDSFGQGRVVEVDTAQAVGMIDGVRSFYDTLRVGFGLKSNNNKRRRLAILK